MSKTPVGEVRPSQLLWTYGPGALIDLPNLSVVTMGIDRWEIGRCQPIQEARLLTNVRRVLGDQVESLRMPPLTDSVIDSVSTWDMMSRLLAPSALRRPISRVRSLTTISMMFMMTMPPTTSERATTPTSTAKMPLVAWW